MPSIKLGNYIINRLKEIGIDTIFGVPGDYSLPFMDLIEDDKEVTWGNNANELNAAYAADGYARIKGAAAVSTAMGVGELSAINGIAGSYAEMLPVIHIVGTPSTTVMEQKTIMHHTLGNGDFDVFFKMASMVTIASAKLSLDTATQEVDRVIETAYINKRPGYLSIPLDLIFANVEIPDTIVPLKLSANKKNPSAVQQAALRHALTAIQNAKHPIVIVDVPAIRFNLTDEANAFISKSGFPAFATPMGKGAVDHELPNYRGVYVGSITSAQTQAEYDEADLVIEIGSIPSDINLGGFTSKQTKNNTITINFDHTTVHHTDYRNVGFVEFLPLLTSKIEEKTANFSRVREIESPEIEDTPIITQNYFWNAIPKFMSRNPIVITEHGTSLSGATSLHGLGKSTYLNQYLWGSIGYSVGATLGASMAARDRTAYLFVGDGSFQMAAQEVSVFIRQGITPVIILINNDGYLIEKLIRGPQRSYNNFQMWRYSKTLDYFGGHIKMNSIGSDKHPSIIGVEAKVSTRQAFEKVMTQVKEAPNKIHFIEVVFSAFDSPYELSALCSTYKRKMEEMTSN